MEPVSDLLIPRHGNHSDCHTDRMSENTERGEPMKIHILSDLHLEHMQFEFEGTDAGVVVLAGDIGSGTSGVSWAEDNIPGHYRIIYVAGNHEHYGQMLSENLRQITDSASRNCSVLENQSVIVGDVRFLGCTLWTDMNLNGNRAEDSQTVGRCMADFQERRVRTGTGGWTARPVITYKGRKYTPEDSIDIHMESRKWLENQLCIDGPWKKNVIVTHHAPSIGSLHPRYTEPHLKGINSGFMSNLDYLFHDFPERIDLWIHGHVHDHFDYHIGETRVVCNPRGYPHENRPNNGRGFDPLFSVEI